MILSDKVASTFKSLLGALPSWKELVRSQFVEHLSIGIGWLHEEASFKVERARQEAFIATALNRSSLLAHGEDREYLPRKPTPSRGRVRITNSGDASVTLLRGRELVSDTQLPFTVEESVIIPPHESATVGVVQRGKTTLLHTIDQEKPFYEILFGRDISHTIMSMGVAVDEGSGFEKWTYERLFENAYADSCVFDEFYHVTDQIGIRFDIRKTLGNGTRTH